MRVVARRKLLFNPAMVRDRSEPPAPDLVLAAQQRGLARTLEKFPELVRSARERGSRPLAAVPTGTLTEPADVFAAVSSASRE